MRAAKAKRRKKIGLRFSSIKAIANNVANLETPGYRRIDVKFEELLAKYLDSSGAVDLSGIKPEIYQPKNTLVKSNGNDTNLLSNNLLLIKKSGKTPTISSSICSTIK